VEVIMANSVHIGVLVAMIAVLHQLHDRTRFKKICLIGDVLAHIALVGIMLYADATLEEFLLVLLVTLAIGMI